VPERQVGLASGLMGLMIMLGLVTGNLIIYAAYSLGTQERADFTIPLLAIAGLVAATGVGTFLWIPNGPPPKPREGRSWSRIAFETFGTDLLEHRSYVFLLASRFFVLMGGGFFMNLNVLFLRGAFGMEDAGDRGPWVFAASIVGVAAAAIGTIPGGRLSDRVGRKPVIYASALLGAIGILVIGLAPVPEVVIAGVAVLGIAFGAFLAVDWALMTDIIPKTSAGRYMGISNIVEALNGAIASALGTFTLFLVARTFGDVIGARTAMLLGVVVFAAGALLLVPVREPPRDRSAEVTPAGQPVSA
jgi:MFS-type transporter involved in bile tolerance (Atg22 family)